MSLKHCSSRVEGFCFWLSSAEGQSGQLVSLNQFTLCDSDVWEDEDAATVRLCWASAVMSIAKTKCTASSRPLSAMVTLLSITLSPWWWPLMISVWFLSFLLFQFFLFMFYLCVPTPGIVRLVTVEIPLCEPPPRAFFHSCSADNYVMMTVFLCYRRLSKFGRCCFCFFSHSMGVVDPSRDLNFD